MQKHLNQALRIHGRKLKNKHFVVHGAAALPVGILQANTALINLSWK